MASDPLKRTGAFTCIFILAIGSLMIASCRHYSLGLRQDAERVRTPYFPTITAENLNNEKVTLPEDFYGNPLLVLIAYKQKQQTNINTWLDRMDEIESAIPGVQIIETPTISSGKWGWMAVFIDGGMRSGIPSTEGRERTITLYTDVSLFNQALMIDSTGTIYAVLLDRDGEIVEMVAGDYTPAKLDTLRPN